MTNGILPAAVTGVDMVAPDMAFVEAVLATDELGGVEVIEGVSPLLPQTSARNGRPLLFAPPEKATALALQAFVRKVSEPQKDRGLTATLSRYIEKLKAPLEDNTQRANPMMFLNATARFILQTEGVPLQGAAVKVLPSVGRLIEQAKILLLLNVFRYEDKDLFERYWHFLNIRTANMLLENLADVLFTEYRDNETDLRIGEKWAYERVIQRANITHLYSILLTWVEKLFPDTAGVFGRRLYEHGFERTQDILQQAAGQVRQAKKKLSDIAFEEMLKPRPRVTITTVSAAH